jgi:Gram-negative bacterial TonB protein C-terminal
MKFPSFITDSKPQMLTTKRFNFVIFVCCLFITLLEVSAQRIAIITPDENTQSLTLKEKLSSSLSKNHKIINGDLVKSVFKSTAFENSFNLSTEESQNFGNAVGCDYFLLLKAENLRRTSFEKNEYYESYAAIYLVSSRTGRLIFWKLKNAEDENPTSADQKLFASIDDLSTEISTNISLSAKNEIIEVLPKVMELPDENSPESKNFRSPLPYRRIRPNYTATAGTYGVKATVDALVDLDENGKVMRIGIMRWAGYGLDESVIKTINEMQWRAASRDGKPLPIRVLLRYNFKKIEKED